MIKRVFLRDAVLKAEAIGARGAVFIWRAVTGECAFRRETIIMLKTMAAAAAAASESRNKRRRRRNAG